MNSMFKNIDLLSAKAKTYLDETESLLGKLLQATRDCNNQDLSDEDRILKVQMVLQYRLSCEDAMSFLLKLDNNMLHFLGIQPHQSAEIILDRLSYVIGNEDLKQILNVLAILTGSLSKIIAQYKNTHSSYALHHRSSHAHHTIIRECSKLLDKQNQFFKVLQQLDAEIELLMKQQAGEPIYDYIAALRGPISHFHQAITHGLKMGKQLYMELNTSAHIEYKLTNLLNETEQVVQSMPSIYTPHPNPYSKTLDQTGEQLEQRAAAKRLRPFFG